MVDKFRARGILSCYDLSNLVLLNSFKSGDAIKYKYKIPNEQNGENLYLIISDKSNIVVINGNLRKFWYGKRNVFNDLSYTAYIKCLRLISRQLRADIFELLQFNLGFIEIGINTKLNRKYDRILVSMKSFPKRKMVNYLNETILFPAIKSDVIAYDKLKESVEKFVKNKALREKILEMNFCLRFELRIRSKSGLKIKKELKTFESIKDNWNTIIDYILEQFFLIEIVDDFSRVKDNLPLHLNFTQLKDLYIFLTIDTLGIEESDKFISSNCGRKKSEFRRKFRKIFNEFRSEDKSDLGVTVTELVEKRANQLKRDNSVLII